MCDGAGSGGVTGSGNVRRRSAATDPLRCHVNGSIMLGSTGSFAGSLVGPCTHGVIDGAGEPGAVRGFGLGLFDRASCLVGSGLDERVMNGL